MAGKPKFFIYWQDAQEITLPIPLNAVIIDSFHQQEHLTLNLP